jgi:glycosyltransferase involved in cell wall biosynthesis
MCGSQATANTKAKLGACFDKPSSVAFSNSSTIEFARDSENMALRRSVDGALDNGRSILDSSSSEEIVFLAFGQIRDGKNLDLFLRAMTRLPENVKMLVAGRGESGSSRPPEFYQSLAEELGVAHRCRWDIRRIPEEEMGDIFAVSDIVLLTYSAKFRSASGVLNAAVFARKPVLASSGPGALKTAVQKYHLGVFVEPDNLESTLSGARILTRNWNFNTQCAESNAHKQIEDSYYCQMVAESVNSKESQSNSSLYSIPLKPDWERYEHENSWKENARSVINAFRC